MLQVRKARQEDAPELLRLIAALADYEKLPPPDEDAQRRLIYDLFRDSPRVEALLVEIDRQPAGYAFFFETYSTFLALPSLYLEDLFVAPEFRGLGAGAALFRSVADEAHKRGCGRMEWAVLDWNRLAVDFYERFGATRLEEWQPYRLTHDQLGAIRWSA